MAVSPKIDHPRTVVLDLEGNDGRERGEDDTSFERQTALFALAVADVVLINMWAKDIGRESGAGKPLLKTIFQVCIWWGDGMYGLHIGVHADVHAVVLAKVSTCLHIYLHAYTYMLAIHMYTIHKYTPPPFRLTSSSSPLPPISAALCCYLCFVIAPKHHWTR